MASFLIATVPVIGHITPLIPIARELVARGHTVGWYTGQKYQAKVKATGARYFPMHAAYDYDDSDVNSAFPERAKLRGLPQLKYDLKHLFADPVVGQVQDLRDILASFPVDAFISDTAFGGTLYLSELGGPPTAVVGISVLTSSSRDTAPFGMALQPSSSPLGRIRNRALYWLANEVLFRDVNQHANRIRARFGLPPSSHGFMDSPLGGALYIHTGIPELEYPRSDLPSHVHFIGPFLSEPSADFTPPAWWDEMVASKRPVIHVTQGTVATDAHELIVPTLQALAEEDVLVVAVTGGKPVESVNLPALPSNVRIEPFIPYAHLLPHVTAMITNGGYGGVQIALAHGVPLIVAGGSEEKPEIANRVAWSGAGINLKTGKPTPAQLRQAVRTILTDPRYRHRAQQLQEAYAHYDARNQAITLLEQLAAKKPVGPNPTSQQWDPSFKQA